MSTKPTGGPNKPSFNIDILGIELKRSDASAEIKEKGKFFAGHEVSWLKVAWHLGFGRGLMYLFNSSGYANFVNKKLDKYEASEKKQEIRVMEDTLMKGLDGLHLKQENMESNAQIRINEVSYESIPSMWGEERINQVIGGSMVLTILQEIKKQPEEKQEEYRDTLSKNIQKLPEGDFKFGASTKFSHITESR